MVGGTKKSSVYVGTAYKLISFSGTCCGCLFEALMLTLHYNPLALLGQQQNN